MSEQSDRNFEQFIIQCCEMDEWDLRTFLKDKLTAAGFTVKNDNYKSHRRGRYQEVHNMLAIRGDNAQVCLVAHTDVCRDHGYSRDIYGHNKAKPVIKNIDVRGINYRIIQDEKAQVQVGGDDRLGVAINAWIAIHTGYDLGILLTTDEETGAVSADSLDFDELIGFKLLCEVDRGNYSNQLVTNISGVRLCSDKTAHRLLDISANIGLPRMQVMGFLTDVLAIKRNKMCQDAVNMTCGYHNSIGNSPNEFIIVKEALETKTYVHEIIKNYELAAIDNILNNRIDERDSVADNKFVDNSNTFASNFAG